MLIFNIYNYLKQITIASISNYKIFLAFLIVIVVLGLIFWIFFIGIIFFDNKINKNLVQKINFKTVIEQLHFSIAREFLTFCFLVTQLFFLSFVIISLILIFSGETQGKIFISKIFYNNFSFVINNITNNWTGMIIEIVLIIIFSSFFVHSIFDLRVGNNEATTGIRILLNISLICSIIFLIDVLYNIFLHGIF